MYLYILHTVYLLMIVYVYHYICWATLRLSSAASSFLWISSSETSFFLGVESGNSPLESGAVGLKMTSNAWPEARLSNSFT